MIPVRKMLRTCREQSRELKIADSSGKEYTGRQVLINSFVLRNFLRRTVLDRNETNVGVLLPTSCATVLLNVALTLDRRVAVNLNFTVSEEIMNHCIKTAGLKHVLTSRKVLAKLNYKNLDAELVILEDLLPKISLRDKLFGAATALLPPWLSERILGLDKIKPDDLLTLIFTSGSTGIPKAVMLMHDNLASNIASFCTTQNMDRDTLLGILPSFHSMGYSYNIWAVLTTHFKGVYHYSPLETAEIGRLCRKYKCTIVAGAPTFFRNFIRRIPAEDFASLISPLVGAERMPKEVADAFEEKFGVRPLEAYGCTECAPVVTMNLLPRAIVPEGMIREKEGSIGRAMPGVEVEIRDIQTRLPLPTDEVGMMWAKGPNVMKGYLNEPAKTAEVLVDGWYCTGDLARKDKDGFVFITGRLSRFSKIGGEMVPHEGIENVISSIVGCSPEDPISITASSIPDKNKGEKIIILYTDLKGFEPAQIVKTMRQMGQPPIWIPAIDSFFKVEAIPLLGTGKLDIQGAKTLARIVTDPFLSVQAGPESNVVGAVESSEDIVSSPANEIAVPPRT